MGATQGLKRTPLYGVQRAWGARFGEFAGWELPISYAGVIEEHLAVRTAVGVFDVSHMGEIVVTGDLALEVIQEVTCNDASRLADGQVQYTALMNPSGGVVDDATLYRLGKDRYMFTVNAANTQKDLEWLRLHNDGRAQIEDRSAHFCLLAIQGPLAETVLGRVVPVDLTAIRRYWFTATAFDGAEAILSRTGYTGEDGFEAYLPAAAATALWERLLEEGKPFGIRPTGLGARDTLRLEACYALYGHELNDGVTPLEANLGWIVKFQKPVFLGKEALERQRADGLKRKLVGFEMLEPGIPRAHYPVWAGGREAGQVTSGTFSPTLKKAIGLAYVPVEATAPGVEIEIGIRARRAKARIVPTPFYKRAG